MCVCVCVCLRSGGVWREGRVKWMGKSRGKRAQCMYETHRRRLFSAARRGAARRGVTRRGHHVGPAADSVGGFRSWPPVSPRASSRPPDPRPAVTSRDGLPAGLARPGRATCKAREARRRLEAEEGAGLLDAAFGGAPLHGLIKGETQRIGPRAPVADDATTALSALRSRGPLVHTYTHALPPCYSRAPTMQPLE